MPGRATTYPPNNIPPDPPGGKVLHVARVSDAILYVKANFYQLQYSKWPIYV
jgi:hypothetical protein